jgi:hypothetical protein
MDPAVVARQLVELWTGGGDADGDAELEQQLNVWRGSVEHKPLVMTFLQTAVQELAARGTAPTAQALAVLNDLQDVLLREWSTAVEALDYLAAVVSCKPVAVVQNTAVELVLQRFCDAALAGPCDERNAMPHALALVSEYLCTSQSVSIVTVLRTLFSHGMRVCGCRACRHHVTVPWDYTAVCPVCRGVCRC